MPFGKRLELGPLELYDWKSGLQRGHAVTMARALFRSVGHCNPALVVEVDSQYKHRWDRPPVPAKFEYLEVGAENGC